MDAIDQQIGALMAEVANLKSEVSEIKTDMRTLLAFTEQARGSWKTVVAISGFAAAAFGTIGNNTLLILSGHYQV